MNAALAPLASPLQAVTTDSSLEALRLAVRDLDARRAEIIDLTEKYAAVHEILSDLEKINAAIKSSPRPDLIITAPAEMLKIESLQDLPRVNNFPMKLGGFGEWKFETGQDPYLNNGKEYQQYAGRNPPTKEDLAFYLLIGACGGYEEFIEFAMQNKLTFDVAQDMILNSHINKPAFIRMLILAPELTHKIISNCTDGTPRTSNTAVEIFIAYSIMSKLVDKNDVNVTKEDGTIDDWMLCR